MVEMQQVKRVNYEKAVSPVIATILMVAITVVLSGVLYVWAANLAESNTDGTFEMYTFSAASAPGEMTSETNDNLIIVTMDQGGDIDWAKVDVKISIAGAASVTCAGPGETTGACIVLESDPTGNVWGIGEAVTIKENGVDLCDGDTCEVTVSIINERDGVTLDESSTTAESTELPPNPCYAKVLYNTQTHQVKTKSGIEGGDDTWMLLPETSDYEHPAYYHKQLHKVLDCSEGASVSDGNGGTWMLTEMSSGGGSHGGGDSGSGGSGSGDSTETVCDDGVDNDNDGDVDGDDSDCASTPPADPDCDDSYLLYNTQSHAHWTNQQVQNREADDGTYFWVLLNPNDWPDYNHPAYYDRNSHRVLDCSQGASVDNWILYASSGGGSHGGGDSGSGGSGDGGSGDSGSGDSSSNANPSCDDSFVLYGGGANNHASYTQQQVKDGDAPNWNWLDPQQYPDYNHPAYYYSAGPQSNHDILDCTQDDSVNGWTLVEPQQN